MRSPNHRNGEIPNGRPSKKVRRDDVVTSSPPGAEDCHPGDNHDDMLTLSLSIPQNNIYLHQEETAAPMAAPPPPPPPHQSYAPAFLPNIPMPLQLPVSHSLYQQHLRGPHFGLVPPPPPPPPSSSSSLPVVSHASRPPRPRKNSTQNPKQEGKPSTVPVPFPWATDERARVKTYKDLIDKEIDTITGGVQCKKCEKQYDVAYNLREKFLEVYRFVAQNRGSLNDRAPPVWMNPTLLTCKFCHQENSVRPVVAMKKRKINWLFLLLGQMLGCCTLEQLKYFCKHTGNHRTGAKDRVLYLTYLDLCKQLAPTGPFDLRL